MDALGIVRRLIEKIGEISVRMDRKLSNGGKGLDGWRDFKQYYRGDWISREMLGWRRVWMDREV